MRTITGTSNRLTVTNGDGVSGNPTLDISSSYVGQSSITTVGRLGSLTVGGTISGTTLNITGLKSCSTIGTDVNGLMSCGGMVIKKKLANQAFSTTTLANVTDMSFAVGSTENWAYRFSLIVSSSVTTAGWKPTVTAPASAVCQIMSAQDGGTSGGSTVTCGAAIANSTSVVAKTGYEVYGSVATNGTSGTAQLQWAANASGTSNVLSGSTLLAFKTVGSDIAEIYQSKDTAVIPGTVVQMDPSLTAGVKMTDAPYQATTLGVISTKPGLAIGGDDLGKAQGAPVFLALAGRVPVLVSSENGPIVPGDFLTSSSTPGVAMKATRPGPVIGQAMTGYNESGIGVVIIFIKNDSLPDSAFAVTPTAQDTVGSSFSGAILQLQAQNSTMSGSIVTLQSSLNSTRTLLRSEMDQKNQALEDRLHAYVDSKLALLSGSVVSSSFTAFTNQTLTGSLTLTGDLSADTLQLQSTLSVSSDARVAGDLYLEGSLIAPNLYLPQGLTVDGTLALHGSMQAQSIDVQTGALFHNGLTVESGELVLGSGATLNFATGSTLSLASLLVKNSLQVLGDITVQGMASFLKDVAVHGELKVSKRQAGYAEIGTGQTIVTVRFGTGFAAVPIVSASPDTPVLYAVSKATATGFTIHLKEPADATITFSWLALATDNPQTATGTGGAAQTASVSQSALPDIVPPAPQSSSAEAVSSQADSSTAATSSDAAATSSDAPAASDSVPASDPVPGPQPVPMGPDTGFEITP